VEGADKVYLASPSMMLVYPTAHHVVLRYQTSAVEYLGAALSVLAALSLAAYYLLFERKANPRGKAGVRQSRTRA
jgi:hypothetical protein